MMRQDDDGEMSKELVHKDDVRMCNIDDSHSEVKAIAQGGEMDDGVASLFEGREGNKWEILVYRRNRIVFGCLFWGYAFSSLLEERMSFLDMLQVGLFDLTIALLETNYYTTVVQKQFLCLWLFLPGWICLYSMAQDQHAPPV